MLRLLMFGLVLMATIEPASALQRDRFPSASELDIHFDVEKYQLSNGLTILLHQDRTVPLVSYQTWFKVGSKDEERGYTGIAHLFEHMMFKGAKRYSNSEFDKVLKSTGASYNAFTTQDYTGYYIDVSSDKLELAMDLESDRLEFLQLSDANLKSEREVVKEERRYRYDNNVMGSLYLQMFDMFFRDSPYRWPVIGYMEDLTAINIQKCKDFFRQYYAPNNAVIVIVGDFDKDNVKHLIEKYYGHMKPSQITRTKQTVDPVLSEPRKKILSKDIQSEVFSLAYGIPGVGSDEGFAFDLLANILTEGTSSRLYNQLVRGTKLVEGISAFNYGLQKQGLFMFTASMKNTAAEKEKEKVLSLVESEISRLKKDKVSQKELEKARTYVMKSYVDGLKTINGRARMLAQYEIYFDDYTRIFSDLEKYNKVTAEEIRILVKQYLNKNQSALVVLTPEKGKKQASTKK